MDGSADNVALETGKYRTASDKVCMKATLPAGSVNSDIAMTFSDHS